MAIFDLRAQGSAVTIGGVRFEDAQNLGSGTGNFNTFLALGDNDGDSRGFNSDDEGSQNPGNPDIDLAKSEAILLSTIPITIVGGEEFYEIRLDLNESNSGLDPQLSLDIFKLYVSTNGGIESLTDLAALGILKYNLDAGGDNTLQLLDVSSGSGTDDYVFLVPVDLFAGVDPATNFLYLEIGFGALGGDFAEEGGFEELNIRTAGTLTGTKFNDLDSDGVRDAGESGVEGVTIFIDANQNGTLDAGERSTLTAADGSYSFFGVIAGTYQIDEVVPAGATQTTGAFETATVPTTPGAIVVVDPIGNHFPVPNFTIAKSVVDIDGDTTDPVANDAGDEIHYSIILTNNGEVTLTNVVVTDPFADPASIVRGSDIIGDNDALFEVGEQWSYTATHTVTQAEIDSNGGGNGALENTATADSDQVGPKNDDASVPVSRTPSLNIVKNASVPGGTADAGELISYAITVQNTGNTTLTNVVVTDPFADPGSITRIADASGDNDALLEVGETWAYAATHTVTQAEFDSFGGGDGQLENVATADSEETGPDTDDASVPVTAAAVLNITKNASVPGGTADAAGELISYSITVANLGNVPLNNLVVSDPFADPGSITRIADSTGDNDAVFEPGEVWAYTATHTVTQAEIDSNGGGNGQLENIATADSDETPPDTDDASVPVDRNPSLNITKDASVPGGTADAAGEVISYAITVANTGNTTLTNVVVTDPFADPGSITRIADQSGDNDALLEVGEIWAYTAAHTVTQAELDSNGGGNGQLENTATADSEETGPDTDDASVPVAPSPALNITKDASVPGGTADAAGEVISYAISVANTGNVTLTGVVVTDPFADPGSITRIADQSGDNDALLEVGEVWAYSATHTVTQAEIDSDGGGNGQLENTATVNSNETPPDTDDASVPVDRNPALTITKDASVPGGTADLAGEAISYAITVANSGNATLSNIVVTDPFADPGSIVRGADQTGDGDDLLEVGEVWTYTAQHTVTQAEIDSNGGGNGLLENTATADSDESDPDDDDADVPVEQRITVDIEKLVSVDGGNTYADADSPTGPEVDLPGGEIFFKLIVTNTGNTTLTGAEVLDTDFDLDPGAGVSWIVGGDGILDPGETAELIISAPFQIGQHVNTADVDTNEGATDTDSAHYFGLEQGPGVRTPGFWQNPNNGGQFWDGIPGNEKNAGQDGFPSGDLLYPVDSNGDGVINGSDVQGLLIGDYSRDGIENFGEDTLFIDLRAAQTFINASQKDQQDGRYKIGRDVTATWLNFLAGNPIGESVVDGIYTPREAIDDAIDFLQLFGDANNNGINFASNRPELTGIAIKESSPAWKTNGPTFESGAEIHSALDQYNNTGAIDLTAFAHDGDDTFFITVLGMI